jgi:prefoldin subunit 5
MDEYAKTFPTEDRARLFEYIISTEDYVPYYMKSPHIIAKYKLLEKWIKEAYGVEEVKFLHDYIEKIEKFDKKLSDLDDLMKDIDEELHKKNKVQKSKTTKPLESDDFNILYVHKKIVEAERDRLILKTEFERLLEDKKDFSKRIDKLEENFQELTGGLNQIRLSLSRITTEKSETQKKNQ